MLDSSNDLMPRPKRNRKLPTRNVLDVDFAAPSSEFIMDDLLLNKTPSQQDCEVLSELWGRDTNTVAASISARMTSQVKVGNLTAPHHNNDKTARTGTATAAVAKRVILHNSINKSKSYKDILNKRRQETNKVDFGMHVFVPPMVVDRINRAQSKSCEPADVRLQRVYEERNNERNDLLRDKTNEQNNQSCNAQESHDKDSSVLQAEMDEGMPEKDTSVEKNNTKESHNEEASVRDHAEESTISNEDDKENYIGSDGDKDKSIKNQALAVFIRKGIRNLIGAIAAEVDEVTLTTREDANELAETTLVDSVIESKDIQNCVNDIENNNEDQKDTVIRNSKSDIEEEINKMIEQEINIEEQIQAEIEAEYEKNIAKSIGKAVKEDRYESENDEDSEEEYQEEEESEYDESEYEPESGIYDYPANMNIKDKGPKPLQHPPAQRTHMIFEKTPSRSSRENSDKVIDMKQDLDLADSYEFSVTDSVSDASEPLTEDLLQSSHVNIDKEDLIVKTNIPKALATVSFPEPNNTALVMSDCNSNVKQGKVSLMMEGEFERCIQSVHIVISDKKSKTKRLPKDKVSKKKRKVIEPATLSVQSINKRAKSNAILDKPASTNGEVDMFSNELHERDTPEKIYEKIFEMMKVKPVTTPVSLQEVQQQIPEVKYYTVRPKKNSHSKLTLLKERNSLDWAVNGQDKDRKKRAAGILRQLRLSHKFNQAFIMKKHIKSSWRAE